MSTEGDRLTRLETVVERIEEAIQGIRDSFAALTRLEERHAETREALGRAFEGIEKMDERVRAVETEMPSLKQVKQWVYSGVGFTVATVGAAVIYLVVRH